MDCGCKSPAFGGIAAGGTSDDDDDNDEVSLSSNAATVPRKTTMSSLLLSKKKITMMTMRTTINRRWNTCHTIYTEDATITATTTESNFQIDIDNCDNNAVVWR